MDDRELMSLLEEDPEQGIPLLKARFAETLRYTVSRRLESPDDIWECVYDTLTDFYFQRHRFDSAKGSLRSYLTAIADRKAIRKYRENQRQRAAAELSRSEWEEQEPEGLLLNREQREQLRLSLQRLPPADRLLMELKYFSGCTLREIAEAMDMEYETVKKRQQRSLKKLQKLMEE